MKKKLLYIGHSYHAKTRSTKFLTDYLGEFFDVDTILDDSCFSNSQEDYSKMVSDYFAVVFFQVIPSSLDFQKIKHDNILFFPMFDHSRNWTYFDWLPYKNVKIFNFSKTLHKRLLSWGFNSRYAQYFIEPIECEEGNENEVFFWQRLEWNDINKIAKIFKNKEVKIHLHKALDPGCEFVEPTEEVQKKFQVTYSHWFDTREQMQDLIKSKAFYIAPRDFEGIGMSFLEAMAMGRVVIANNQPTMNEYIQNGINGYLMSFKKPKAISFKDIKKIQTNAKKTVEIGYKNWLNERVKIINFVNETSKSFTPSPKEKLRGALFSPGKPIKLKLGRNPYFSIFGHEIIKRK